MLTLCPNCRATRGFLKWDCEKCIAWWLLGEPRLSVRQEVLDYLKRKEPGLARRAAELVKENWAEKRFRQSITYCGKE